MMIQRNEKQAPGREFGDRGGLYSFAFKPLVLALAAAVAVLAFTGTAFAAKTFVSIATGSTLGTYYPVGLSIAEAVSERSGIQAVAEAGNAAIANINLLARGDVEVAFVQNDVAAWAFAGGQMFTAPLRNVRGIAALFPEHIQVVLSKGANVKALADLRDKRVGVGAPGSGVEADVRAIFLSAGLKYSDVKVDYLDFGATVSRFREDQIDAGFVVAGYPTAAITELAAAKEITLLNFDKPSMDKLCREYPFFVASKVPANTYRGISTDIATPAVVALLVTRDNIPEDVIYRFTKALYDGIADIRASHAKGREITLEGALEGMTVPLHPGAAKFFREKGLDVR